ncbi:hypothetical protein KP003_06915 [Geomonas nitrogeniifigens]|uniref:hypothetical protein n=1 Tax=Geomonas diazotrophica TaxID=2843197 RepID=UPI001C2C7CD3|nr:hypothetical protein [Geomonas nitrogeniifigens]QXE88123.1 hypothetical protein KP003_06915 [Geomonas nitrogeniifigens]
MLTAIITKAIVSTDAIMQETRVKASIVREVAGIAHGIIKEQLPEYRDDLKAKLLDRITASLQKK